MENVLLVAYLLIVLAMIAVILLQRSEGGGLGMGGANAFMTTRGSANVLTRTTAILAALFFVLAIGLTVVKSIDQGSTGILDSANQTVEAGSGTNGTDSTGDAGAADSSVLDALNKLQAQTSGESSATTTAPAADTSAPAGSSAATPEASPAPAADAPALAVPPATDQSGTSGSN